MELAKPLVQLPIRFCAETLAAEAAALPPEAWVEHPNKFEGNDAAFLVTPGGRIVQGFAGPMAATVYLERSPYIRQVMTALGATWGRSRLMRLAPGAEVTRHVDIHYYWRTHWRLHIPVVTTPEVLFNCGDMTVHMAPGECWTFDSFQRHDVQNDGEVWRVHLVLDTVGGGRLWELLAQAQGPNPPEPVFIAPDGSDRHIPLLEQQNVPTVMSHWEVRCHVAEFLRHCQPSPQLPAVTARLDEFVDQWTAAWTAYGDMPEAAEAYVSLIHHARNDLQRLGAEAIELRNGITLFTCLREVLFRVAVKRTEPVGGRPLQRAAR